MTSENPVAVLNDRERYLALARQHYENFPVGSWLLPRAARRHLHRIYAFARTADDLADEQRDAAALAAFRADFWAHVEGESRDVPLFVELAATVAERKLPTKLFFDLLDAFEQDLEVTRYDEDELFSYCRKSADPVGRLVLRVCGHDDPELDTLSDKICTGLQLLNHLQDLGADLRDRDRIYFPREDMQRFGVAEGHLRAETAGPQLRALVRHWAGRVAAMFTVGWPLTERVQGRLRLELRAILHGAAAVLHKIHRVGGDVLGKNVRLGKLQRVGILGRAVTSRKMPDFPVHA